MNGSFDCQAIGRRFLQCASFTRACQLLIGAAAASADWRTLVSVGACACRHHNLVAIHIDTSIDRRTCDIDVFHVPSKILWFKSGSAKLRQRTRDNMLESRTFTRLALLVGLVAVIRTATTSTAHKLNVPRVLLPVFNNFAVNFTLEVTDGGCYKW